MEGYGVIHPSEIASVQFARLGIPEINQLVLLPSVLQTEVDPTSWTE